MLHPHDHFTADADVLFTQLGDDEGVLLHLGTQYYFSLNETGLLIWQCLNNGTSLGDVAVMLRQEYEVDEVGAWEHVCDFVQELQGKKLIVEAPGSAKSAG